MGRSGVRACAIHVIEEIREMKVENRDVEGSDALHVPRKMTLAENVILTVKVLAAFGLMGAGLWGISLWKSAP